MLALIPLFPLIGFVINATLGRRLPKSVSGGLASLAMLASFAVSVTVWWQLVGMPAEDRSIEQVVYTWLASDDLTPLIEFRFAELLAAAGLLAELAVQGADLTSAPRDTLIGVLDELE